MEKAMKGNKVMTLVKDIKTWFIVLLAERINLWQMTIVVLINHGFKVINKKEQNMINSESWSVYAHESEYSN